MYVYSVEAMSHKDRDHCSATLEAFLHLRPKSWFAYTCLDSWQQVNLCCYFQFTSNLLFRMHFADCSSLINSKSHTICSTNMYSTIALGSYCSNYFSDLGVSWYCWTLFKWSAVHSIIYFSYSYIQKFKGRVAQENALQSVPKASCSTTVSPLK